MINPDKDLFSEIETKVRKTCRCSLKYIALKRLSFLFETKVGNREYPKLCPVRSRYLMYYTYTNKEQKILWLIIPSQDSMSQSKMRILSVKDVDNKIFSNIIKMLMNLKPTEIHIKR